MEDYKYLRNAWETCLEMITDRSYTYDEVYNKLDEEEFRYLIRKNQLNIIANNNDKTIYIKFLLSLKVKSATIKELIQHITSKTTNSKDLEMIFVLKSKPNTSLKKLEKLNKVGDLQIMWIKHLQFNLTKHMFVPKHIKLNDDEKKIIIDKYRLYSKQQLPLILKEDPVVRYYNFKKGDILKIEGSIASLNPNYINYRVVK